MRAWTDAAGASRWVAAVIHTSGGFLWTRARLPDALWDQFLPREDEQIGSQELMAVPLLAATFQDYLQGATLTLAIDNSGVVGNVIKGVGSASDHNAAIAKLWLNFAAAWGFAVDHQGGDKVQPCGWAYPRCVRRPSKIERAVGRAEMAVLDC